VRRLCRSCGSLYGKMTSFLPDGRVLPGVVIGHAGAEPVCDACRVVWKLTWIGAMQRALDLTGRPVQMVTVSELRAVYP